jgi:hypothetical protein
VVLAANIIYSLLKFKNPLIILNNWLFYHEKKKKESGVDPGGHLWN